MRERESALCPIQSQDACEYWTGRCRKTAIFVTRCLEIDAGTRRNALLTEYRFHSTAFNSSKNPHCLALHGLVWSFRVLGCNMAAAFDESCDLSVALVLKLL